MESTAMLLLLVVALVIAGAVKGSTGMGLPTTALGILTLALDPRSAIALILVPMLVSNAWQVYRSSEVLRALGTYFPLGAVLVVGVGTTVALTADAPDRFLFGMLGAAILVFVAVNLTPWAPRIPDRLDTPAQITAGALAGILGGLTSVWAPPMAVYLAARRVTKDEFVRASGLLIFLGSVPLAIGYAAQGFLSAREVGISFALLIPTFAGFAAGERLRHRLSETGFRRFLLGIFFVMGLNLIRRAVM